MIKSCQLQGRALPPTLTTGGGRAISFLQSAVGLCVCVVHGPPLWSVHLCAAATRHARRTACLLWRKWSTRNTTSLRVWWRPSTHTQRHRRPSTDQATRTGEVVGQLPLTSFHRPLELPRPSEKSFQVSMENWLEWHSVCRLPTSQWLTLPAALRKGSVSDDYRRCAVIRDLIWLQWNRVSLFAVVLSQYIHITEYRRQTDDIGHRLTKRNFVMQLLEP